MSGKKKGIQPIITRQSMDLFYMTPTSITAKDIAALYEATIGLTVELWADMGVLELILPSQGAIDFEQMEVAFKDSSDAAFIKNRGIQSIFAINLYQEDIPEAIPFFEQLVAKYSGFVCQDSEDFTPVYTGSSKK